jgi:hypothetical protein
VERNWPSHDWEDDSVVLRINDNFQVLDPQGELVVPLVRLKLLELLDLASILSRGGLSESSEALLLLLSSELLLMLTTLRVSLLINIRRPLRTESRACDVLRSNSTDTRVLLLLLRCRLGLLVILEEERVGISACRGF